MTVSQIQNSYIQEKWANAWELDSQKAFPQQVMPQQTMQQMQQQGSQSGMAERNNIFSPEKKSSDIKSLAT